MGIRSTRPIGEIWMELRDRKKLQAQEAEDSDAVVSELERELRDQDDSGRP